MAANEFLVDAEHARKAVLDALGRALTDLQRAAHDELQRIDVAARAVVAMPSRGIDLLASPIAVIREFEVRRGDTIGVRPTMDVATRLEIVADVQGAPHGVHVHVRVNGHDPDVSLEPSRYRLLMFVVPMAEHKEEPAP